MNVRSVLRIGTLWAASAMATGLLFHAADASAAYWKRVPGSACKRFNFQSGVITWNENGTIGGRGTVVCPFQEDSERPKLNVTSVTVYVRDGSNTEGILAQLCTRFSGTHLIFCGAAQTTSGTGFKAMTLSNGWGSVDGWPYLRAILPASGTNNQLSGFIANY
jgi:hypothetical protein